MSNFTNNHTVLKSKVHIEENISFSHKIFTPFLFNHARLKCYYFTGDNIESSNNHEKRVTIGVQKFLYHMQVVTNGIAGRINILT
jgi:hypothetical protein